MEEIMYKTAVVEMHYMKNYVFFPYYFNGIFTFWIKATGRRL